MNRSLCVILSLLALGASAAAQTSIDKPAATIKLTKQELISVRQLKSDVEKLEKVTGKKLEKDMVREILDARINSLLFIQFCEREKIAVSDAEVTKNIDALKANLGNKATDADLELWLRTQGVFVEPKVYVKQRLLFTNYLQARKAADLKAAGAQPTADEILKAYDLSKATLVRPDTMRVSVIYADTRGKSADEAKKSLEQVKGIASVVKANEGRFDEYVLRGSDPASGYKSIPSLYVEKTSQSQSVFGKEFFEAVFKLKPGDVSGVIESTTGYRIVKSNEFLPQKQLTLSDTVPGNPNLTVQEFLTYQVAQGKQAALMDKLEADLINQLRKEATIKIYEENLAI